MINVLENSVDVYLDDGDGPSLEEGFDTIESYAYLDLDSAVPTDSDTLRTDLLHFEKLQFPRDYWILLTDSDRTAAGEIYPYIIHQPFNHFRCDAYEVHSCRWIRAVVILSEDIGGELFAGLNDPCTLLKASHCRDHTSGSFRVA